MFSVGIEVEHRLKIGKQIRKLLRHQTIRRRFFHIAESYNVQVKTLQFDFSNPDGYDDLKEELKELDIGVLGE